MIDELDIAAVIDPREDRHLRKSRSTADQRATGIVANAAEDRGADTRGSDYGMRITAERLQRLLQLEKRGARVADHLPAFINQADLRQAQRTHDYDIAIIVRTIRGRATRKASVGGLHDDDLVCRRAGLDDPPLLDEAPRTDDGQRGSASKPEADAVTARASLAG
jgi:hypothetical protein